MHAVPPGIDLTLIFLAIIFFNFLVQVIKGTLIRK